MAKLMTMFLVLLALEFCLVIYSSTTTEHTTLWNFVMNMDKWNTLDFLVIIGGIAGAAALIGVSAGGSFRFVTDFLVLAPAIVGLVSMGVIFMNFAAILRSTLISTFFTSCATTCAPVQLIIAIIIGPIAFYYAWTVFEWWRTPNA